MVETNPHSKTDKDPNAAMRSNNSEHDDISVGWEGVGMIPKTPMEINTKTMSLKG